MDDVAGLVVVYFAAIIAYWFAVMVFIGWIASQKGRSGVGWFFLALVFNLIALLALMALPNLGPAQPISGLKETAE